MLQHHSACKRVRGNPKDTSKPLDHLPAVLLTTRPGAHLLALCLDSKGRCSAVSSAGISLCIRALLQRCQAVGVAEHLHVHTPPHADNKHAAGFTLKGGLGLRNLMQSVAAHGAVAATGQAPRPPMGAHDPSLGTRVAACQADTCTRHSKNHPPCELDGCRTLAHSLHIQID